ncbi:hypothetical protein [Catenulispora rubra]|uniref:hypothetical protein n=1 Tax=Catenulispora rubra TaxID=280293 RepID=UPI0018924487|nr:hypothetical protein [Catenulispora rubra]
MACSLLDPAACVGDAIGSVVGGAASSAWDAICKDFAKSAAQLLGAFAKAFVAIPNVDLASGGVKSVYGISMGLAAVIAALLLFVQIIRTAVTHDGNALAQGIVGVGKAAMAFLLTLTIAGTALTAADELSAFIVKQSFGSTQALSDKISHLVTWNDGMSASLLLIFAILGILLVVVLWFELLLRNAAFAVLVASSPIAASGQVSEATRAWWSKMVAAAIQLLVLKPIIALVFALGLSMTGDSKDIETMLVGMLVLLMAAVAWPAVARFFSFASVQVGGGAGLGALLGFAAGQMASGTVGAPTGSSPDRFGQEAEARTSAAMARRQEGAATYAATGSAGSAAAGSSGAAKGVAAATGAGGIALAAMSMAQKGVNSLTGRMEQMAGHAGIAGANPYAQPAGRAGHHGALWKAQPSNARVSSSSTDADSAAAGSGAPAMPTGERSQIHDFGSGDLPSEVDRGAPPPTMPEPELRQDAPVPPLASPSSMPAQEEAVPPAAASRSDPPTVEMPAVVQQPINKRRPDEPTKDDFTEAT